MILIVTCSSCSSFLPNFNSPASYAQPNPYKAHEEEIESLYASGKISTEKYLELKQELLIAKQQQQQQQAYQQQQIWQNASQSIPQPKTQLEQIKEQQDMVDMMTGRRNRISTNCVTTGNYTSCN